MTRSIQPMRPTPGVKALLAANQLPVSDLDGTATIVLFGCVTDEQLHGIVGLDVHGDGALLRSLAVSEARRGTGLGAALLAHAEQFAAQQGIRTLYLLTTTAEGFFARHGYRPMLRAEAPAFIAATSQFSQLCPSSSAFMAKSLADEQFPQAGSPRGTT